MKRLLETIGASAAVLMVFAMLGVAMTPGWSVAPNTSHVTVDSPDTAIAAQGVDSASEGRYAVTTSSMRIRLTRTVTVSAVLREPSNAPGRHPACLFIEGAGTGTSKQVFGDIAHAMASAGIVTLVPDKRLDNYTPLHRDYHAMAHDYMTSLNLLRHRPDVDASHTGVYAESEGTWIASVMAHSHPDIGFMILTSPPVVSGRQQMAMATTRYMRYIGAPSPMTRDISKVISMDFSPLGLQYADFPAQRYLSSFTMPLLVNFGTEDISMPIEQGANMLLHATSAAGNHNMTLRYYAANHQMRVGSHAALPGLPLAPEYTHDLEHWINAIAVGTTSDGWSTPMIAGAQPHQTLAVPAHTHPGMVGSLAVLLAIIAVMLVALICAIVGLLILAATGLARMLRTGTRARAGEVPAPARHLRATALRDHASTAPHFSAPLSAALIITVLATAGSIGLLGWYLVAIGRAAVMLNVETAALHWWWHVLRIITCLVVVLVAWTFVELIGIHGSGTRARSAPVAGFGHMLLVALVVVAALTSLLLSAFWGVFTL